MSQRPSYEELEKRINELEEILCADIPSKTQDYLQKILDCSPSAIYTKDLHGRYQFINNKFENLSGFKKKDVIFNTDFELFPESVAQNSTKNDRRVIETGTMLEIEEFAPVEDRMHTFITTKSPLINEDDGKIYEICGVSTDITEQKQAEVKSEQALSQLRTTLDATADGILVVDMNGKIVLFNKRFANMWKLQANIPTFQDDSPVLAIVMDQLKNPDAFRTKVKELYADSLAKSFDTIEFNDGRIFERYSRPHLLNDEVIGRVWSFRDVTDRKQTEYALRKSETKYKENEKKYRLLFETVIHGIQEIDFSGKIVSANSACHMLLGYKNGELVGRSLFEFFSDSYQQKKMSDNIQIILKKQPKPKPWFGKIKKKNGDIFDGQTDWNYKRNKNGEVIGFIFIFSDITERKQAEEALRESKNRFRDIINSMADWIWEVDKKGKYTYVSETVTNSLGYSSGEMIGKTPFEFMLKKERNKVKKIFIQVFSKSEPIVDLENWNLAKNGKTVCLLTNGVPILDSNGKLQGYRGVDKDITNQKKLAEEKVEMEVKLQQAQKMESIGILAGGIAHDFNNLLYVVMGNISLAQDDLKYETGTSESLKAAEEACIKAKELTARLITFSKGGDPVKKKIHICDLLKNTVISALKGFNIKSKIFIPDAIRQVNIDENQIKQVFSNIVVNAREAMDDNEQLTVSCEKINIAENSHLTLSQGEYIKISFEDQGCGISKENFEKIFDPYFSTKDMGLDKGQGLGLTVSYSIVQKHGGLITVESEQEIGSTFSVYLPTISVKKTDPQKSEENSTAQKPVKKPANGTGKILLMDDEEAIRIFMGQVLNRLGYDVETCTEGKETVEIYKKTMESEEPFDVAILDLTNKFGMGGQETMKRLLEIDQNAKGIIITGYFDDPVVADFKAYGFSGVITKPATRDELSKVINEVLSKEN